MIAVLAGLGSAALAGCDDSGDPTSKQVSTKARTGSAALPQTPDVGCPSATLETDPSAPTGFEAKEAWSGEGSATVSGSVAVGLTPAGSLWVSPAARRQICWQVRVDNVVNPEETRHRALAPEDPLPFRLILDGPNEVVVVGYRLESPPSGVKPGGIEYGVAAYRVVDGTPVWRTAFPERIAGADLDVDGAPVIVGVREDVLVTALPGRQRTRTVAVDAKSGKYLWHRPDLVPVALADGTVVGTNHDLVQEYSEGVDLRAGTSLWRRADHAVRLYGAQGRVALVGRGVDPHDNVVDTRWLDVSDGQVLGQTGGNFDIQRCLPGGAFLTCHASPRLAAGEIIAFDPATPGKAAWSVDREAVARTQARPTAVFAGRVYVATNTGGAVLDERTGEQIADHLPVAPDQVTSMFGVVNEIGDRPELDQFTIYRATR